MNPAWMTGRPRRNAKRDTDAANPRPVQAVPRPACLEHKRRRREQAHTGVRRLLRRRHITVVGDWDLFIQYCDWKILVSDGSCDSESFDWRRPDECLRDLDGQRLVGVGGGSLPNSWKFEFDLGGIFELWPSTEYKATNDLWGLYGWDGDAQGMRFVVSVHNDGTVDFEDAWRE